MWIGYILRNNCLLEQVFEGKGKGRRETRRKQLLDDIKETRMFWILRQEALDSLFEEVDLEEVMDLS